MAQMQIQQVRKAFGSQVILKDVSIDVRDGEFLVLVGPSGCGKSTLLRMVAGLEGVTNGLISIDGKDVTNTHPKHRDIAMVFQNYALYPHMTVERNMGFSLEVGGLTKEERRERVSNAADLLGLTPLLHRYPRQLSGGQRQRVAMGRAIVRNPKVFLFDEPLSNLDAKLRTVMRAEIKQLQQRLKTTTIYVTHDQIEAMTMADRIAVMNGGRMEQLGTPMDLYERPANVFVATFIGSPSMNILPGMLERKSARTVFRAEAGGEVELPGPAPVTDEIPILLGVRPENLALSDEGIPATVTVIEPMGPETHVMLNAGGTALVSILREKQMFEVGQTVGVKPVKAPHLFKKEDGTALQFTEIPA